MDISVIIPTYNQQARLSLVLCSLSCQSFKGDLEVLVVDDGCTDGTETVVEGYLASGALNVRLVHGIGRQGRNASRNRGLQQATGRLTVFLDADALPGPELLARYFEAFLAHDGPVLLSGMQYHLPELEHLSDPRTAAIDADSDLPSVVRDFIATNGDRLTVTETMVSNRFEEIHERARRGSYPNEGTVRRQEEARSLLQTRPRSTAAWLAFIPHNGGAATSLLRAAGGFDCDIPFNEGWELAYRCQRQHNAAIVAVEAATYHLYHHHDFSDPAQARTRYDAIEYMAMKHHDPRIRLVYFWYAHLWRDPFIPEAAIVEDLFEFERVYHDLPESTWRQYEMVLQNHPNQLPLKDIEASYGSCA
jgi:glycosyltransferase involved in cell wall biosynthesis